MNANGGFTWEYVSFGNDNNFLGLFFLDENVGWVLPNNVGRSIDNTIHDMEGAIWKTTDGGKTFSLQYGWPSHTNRITEETSLNEKNIPQGPDITSLTFPEPGVGYALGRDTYIGSLNQVHIYRTDSGGVSWDIMSTLYGPPTLLFLNTWHGFCFYVEGNRSPYETFDGGRTWRLRDDLKDLTESFGNWDSIFFTDDQYGWIVKSQSNISERRMWKTTDGGMTWRRLPIPSYSPTGGLRLFFIDRNTGWMVSRMGTIDKTTDGGETWVQQREAMDMTTQLYQIHFTGEDNGWIVGKDGHVLWTADGGATWNEEKLLDSGQASDVYFSSCTRGWLAGYRGSESSPMSIMLETRTGSFSSSQPLPFQFFRHVLSLIDSPDTVNAWAYGDFGAGMKFSAPTDALMIVTPNVPGGRMGVEYSAQLESMNGQPPLTWSICGGSVPPGMELTPAGELAGTPATAATFQFTAAVTDNEGQSAGRRYLLTIEPVLSPSIDTAELPDGYVGKDYAVQLEASGTQKPYVWLLSKGTVPQGLRLFGYGTLGGVPSCPGEYEIEVQVTDGQNPPGSDRRTFSLTIAGDFASVQADPCADYPLFCFSLNWQCPPEAITYGDSEGDGDVDEDDLLELIRTIRGN